MHDFNPLHHDLAAAKAQGYRGLIASARSSAASSWRWTATPLREARRATAGQRSGVGMGFEIRFRAPVYAEEDIDLRWTVTGVERRGEPERLDHPGSRARPGPARRLLMSGTGALCCAAEARLAAP